MGKVITWRQAIELGHDPRSYGYRREKVPEGWSTGKLDFKIWAKKVFGINCYFTLPESQQKIVLTVYLSNKDGSYRIAGCAIDFHSCPADELYRIQTLHTEKRVVFSDAVLLGKQKG